MRRPLIHHAFAARIATLAALLALSGCESTSAPSVSSSSTEVTVHGKVTYKGQPVTEGEIVFDPANIQRKDAKMVSAPIGQDGTYTIKTLQGENTISFRLPNLSKQDFQAATASSNYNAPAGDSTKDIELVAPREP